MILPERYILKDACIVDGTGKAAFRGSVIVKDGKIEKIQEAIPDCNTATIDCHGDILSPAFIDPHSHSDAAPFLPQGFRPKISQGIATEGCGVCGLGIAPMPKERQAGWRQTLVIGDPDIAWNWESSAQWYREVRQSGLECNLAPFVGHGTLRYAVAGDSSEVLSPRQRSEMRELLQDAFQSGARGLSFGLIYIPALFADREELLLCAREAARFNRPIAVHMRSESDALLEAMQEIFDICREAGARLHISHLKAIGRENQAKIPAALEFIEKHNLSFDSYPYDFGSTSLMSLLPPDLSKGRNISQLLDYLGDEESMEIADAYYSGKWTLPESAPWDNLPKLLGWDAISIADLPGLEGRSIRSIAEERRCTPVKALFSLIREHDGAGRMFDRFSCPESIETILRHPLGMLSSDTLLEGRLHPRVYGSFPRFFRTMVQERHLISLEEAVRKSSSAAAELLGLPDRGIIAAGKRADLVLFTREISDRSTAQEPCRESRGIRSLFINGHPKILEYQYLNRRDGELLLHG